MGKITKKQIKAINNTASVNFEKAKGMLEMLNMIYGTNFKFLAGRVCFEKDCRTHDAWVWAED